MRGGKYMVVTYDNLSVRKFHKVIPILAPCECEREEDSSARYNVRIIGKDKTRLVTNVFIQCTSCKSEKLFDIAQEKRNINDIVF